MIIDHEVMLWERFLGKSCEPQVNASGRALTLSWMDNGRDQLGGESRVFALSCSQGAKSQAAASRIIDAATPRSTSIFHWGCASRSIKRARSSFILDEKRARGCSIQVSWYRCIWGISCLWCARYFRCFWFSCCFRTATSANQIICFRDFKIIKLEDNQSDFT